MSDGREHPRKGRRPDGTLINHSRAAVLFRLRYARQFDSPWLSQDRRHKSYPITTVTALTHSLTHYLSKAWKCKILRFLAKTTQMLEVCVGEMAMGLVGEMAMGLVGEMAMGLVGEMAMGLVGEMAMGLVGEMAMGLVGEMAMGLVGEMAMGLVGEMAMGLVGEMAMGLVGEMAMGLSCF